MNEKFTEIELKKYDLNALLVFTALMHERSVTKAAKRLLVGPPAVSMTLARLRELFDDPLFVRAGKAMEPTSRAERLFARIGPALGEISDVIRSHSGFDPATSSRTIRFASPDDLEVVLVPAILEAMADCAPGVKLVVRSADFRNVPDLLDDGEVDVALTATPPQLEKRHRYRVIYEDTFTALYDPAQTAITSPVTLEQYIEVPQILLSTRGDWRGPIDDALATFGRTRQVLASVPRFSTIPFILKSRSSLVNMPSKSASHYAKLYGLATSALPFSSPRFSVSILWHLRAEQDPAVIWFRNLTESCLKKLL
ncbi:LysR family transcriptional regulator [Denitrobaculum tricleocarpae]|uniref:LysR family transcriptional regulator n=1 Tax=Denitrobaculum tricleocarpae TaxID=2591009 RepID=A0A545TAX2_9PROT|nr:LysR family transcriptional regulator [Denitrobaculum tricleocarpae]TQV74357.1 LysR family transcriptional regulator [Denitrobaculum tricleocarpae]